MITTRKCMQDADCTMRRIMLSVSGQKLQSFLTTGQSPNILMHGPSGSGKRTALTEFVKQLYQNDAASVSEMVMWVDCTNKGIEFIRGDLKFFAKKCVGCSTTTFKSIVLFDADMLTMDAQSALRRCIEQYSASTRFFSTVQDKGRLSAPIQSRFCEIYIPCVLDELTCTSVNLHTAQLDEALSKCIRTEITPHHCDNQLCDNANYHDLIAALTHANLSASSVFSDVSTLAETLYDDGWSGCDLTVVFKSHQMCCAARVLRTEVEKASVLPAFYNLQTCVRCEPFVMTTMLYMMYVDIDGSPSTLRVM